MTSTNPYDPPYTESEIETVTPAKVARHSLRDFVIVAMLAGIGIGGGIGFLRLLVEGFSWRDAVRDLLVGSTVGIAGGVIWFGVHYCILWIRTFRGTGEMS